MSHEEVMRRTAMGKYDVSIMDSLFLEEWLPLHPEVRASIDVSPLLFMVWGVRAKAGTLRDQLDEFISRHNLRRQAGQVSVEDFDPRRPPRRPLRLITIPDQLHYYLRQGERRGFEYDLFHRFARQHKLRLEVLTAGSQQEMLEMLRSGQGDVIAASVPRQCAADLPGVRATRGYLSVFPVLLGRRDEDDFLWEIDRLQQRRITLSATSPWRDCLETLREQGFEFSLAQSSLVSNDAAALRMVGLGMFDLTVVGSHQLPSLRGLRQAHDLEHVLIGEPQDLVWLVRAGNRQLLAALDEYVKDNARGEHFNLVQEKYFSAPPSGAPEEPGSLSKYDRIVSRYAAEHGFDWHLIMAMMFQESRFDPHALSVAGAQGLMQLTKGTQELMNVDDAQDPRQNIAAGIKYLAQLRDRFEPELLPEERAWFSLAAYNAGFSRIRQARERTAEMGLDRDRWFGNVERAMLAMAKPFLRDGERTRICRCGETVVYVRDIKARYSDYLNYFRHHPPHPPAGEDDARP